MSEPLEKPSEVLNTYMSTLETMANEANEALEASLQNSRAVSRLIAKLNEWDDMWTGKENGVVYPYESHEEASRAMGVRADLEAQIASYEQRLMVDRARLAVAHAILLRQRRDAMEKVGDFLRRQEAQRLLKLEKENTTDSDTKKDEE